MSQSLIPRQVALRVGLAARELPTIDTKVLLRVLLELGRGTLSLEALERIGIRQFRERLRKEGEVTRTEAARALVQLRRFRSLPSDEEEPRPGALPRLESAHLLVAFASNEGRWLDGSFARCKQFLVYEVGEHDARLIEIREAKPAKSCLDPTGDKPRDNLGNRTGLLDDCKILYTLSVGTPAKARLVRAHIHPVCLSRPVPCSHVLSRLQHVMRSAPPPWMQKLMRAQEKPLSSVN
jgi:nitrogen fixation protein NifX